MAKTAWSSPSSQYGMGGMTSGRGNAVHAEKKNAFAAAYNPAILARQHRPLFSVGTFAAGQSYQSLNNVQIASPAGEMRTENYTPPGDTTALWTLGLTYPFFIPNLDRGMGIGVALTGPFGRLRSFSSYSPQDFYLLRYGASDSQFNATVGSGIEIIPETLYFGAGVAFFLSGAGAAESTLTPENPTGRMAFDVGLQSAAILGVYGEWQDTAMGLTFHQEKDPTFVQSFNGIVPVGNASVQQPIVASTSLYYEPHNFNWDLQQKWEEWTFALGLSYEIWERYRAPVLITETVGADGTPHKTQNPTFALRNTWNPKVAVKRVFLNAKLELNSGYQFRPSPIVDLSGPSNALDSDTHVFSLSLSHHLRTADESDDFPISWGLFGQYHLMTERTVTKSRADVTGAPGYTFSGKSVTYGAFLEVAL